MLNTTSQNRIIRGQVDEKEPSKYSQYTDNELIELLNSKIATDRTCAATLLGTRKSKEIIDTLVNALQKEKSLYAKIAISEALGKIGQSAVPQLITLLGKFGNNQYKTLPDKPFNKWNYPLPRDIAARTLTKSGQGAINQLIEAINKLSIEALSEAIDTLGYLSYYHKDRSAFEVLEKLLNQHQSNDLIVWKIIRAFQGFPSAKTISILENHLTHSQQAIKWEAERSLAQIQRKY